MILNTTGQKTLSIAIIVMVTIGLFHLGVESALAHGGKSHGDNEFTSFQAVQKALQLYDRLIISGKIDETWEIGLASINVDTRQVADKKEYVVKFKRSQGEPDSVYFFFDLKGEYSGSNFTGE